MVTKAVQALIAVALVAGGWGLATPAYAEPPLPGCGSAVAGNWHNIDPYTRAVTRVGNVVDCYASYHGTTHVWGKCTPTDCDWGTTGINAAADLAWDGYYVTGFATKYIWMKTYASSDGNTYLRVYVSVHYTDDSGRADRVTDEWFLRDR